MDKEQIGEIILRQRTELGLTQQQLADKLGVRRQSIIEIEQSQYNYRIDRLMELLDGLDLKLLVVKKDATQAMISTSPVKGGISHAEIIIFRGVKPLLEIPDGIEKKSTKKVGKV